MKYLKKRLRNYGFWISFFALIPVIAQAFGVFKIPDNYDELVNGILTLLIAAGVVSDPTTKAKWYKDDKDKK